MSGAPAFSGAEALVTGGAGFVGSHLVRRLLEAGASVTVLAQPGVPRGALEAVAARIHVLEADLTDPEGVERALAGCTPCYVFHLAAWTGGRSRASDPAAWRLSARINLEGTLNLLAALAPRAAAIARVVRTGGMEEYGDGPVPFREDQRESAVSPYSASQVAATQAAHAYAARAGLALTTVRPALIYGPGQDTSFFLPALIEACLAGRDFEMTSGEQTCDFVYVADVVEALLKAATAPAAAGEIVNAGSGREVRVRDLAERVAALTDAAGTLRIGARADRAGESSRRFMDAGKALRLFGWTAATPLEEGLRHTIDSLRPGARPAG